MKGHRGLGWMTLLLTAAAWASSGENGLPSGLDSRSSMTGEMRPLESNSPPASRLFRLETIAGRITHVFQFRGARPGQPMIEVTMQRGAQVERIRLAPAWFLLEHGFSTQPGDLISVIGYRLPVRDGRVLFATEILKDARRLELRNPRRKPLWLPDWCF